MANGYLSMGKCYVTANEAIEGYYSSQSPTLRNNSSTQSMYFFVKNSSGVWKVLNFDPNTGTSSTSPTAPSAVYGTCDLSINDYDYASAAAMWSFAFVTVFGLWYLSKNLGMIISAVRRW